MNLHAVVQWWRRLWLPNPETLDRRTKNADSTLEQALADHYRRRHPPAPPSNVQVDWLQAPEGFTRWRYDDRHRQAYWMTGRSRIEEYGEVWESAPAPSFGATELCQVIMTPEDEGRRRAAREQVALHDAWRDQALRDAPASRPRQRL